MKGKGILIMLAACGACLLIGHSWHALADGAPTPPSLFYSGTLEQDGQAANGDFTITLRIYDAASGGNELCETESDAEVEQGRFRIDASACYQALRDESDSWVAVAFEGSDGVTRTIQGRSKIGAVPYALEADHSISASEAEGALASALQTITERLDALESESTKRSGFQAFAKLDQTGTARQSTKVIFDEEQFDFDSEYDPATGIFTTKDGGYYEFSCIIAWAAEGGVIGQWEASLWLNDFERFYNGDTTDGGGATRIIHGVLRLQPGERVHCRALQDVATPINTEFAYTTFEGRRFAL